MYERYNDDSNTHLSAFQKGICKTETRFVYNFIPIDIYSYTIRFE